MSDLVAEVAAWLPRRRRPARTVLCYHEVTPGPAAGRYGVTRATLERHLELLAADGPPVVGAAALADAERPGVALTFDDNEASHVEQALPALRSAGVTATFFVNPGELGEAGRLDRAGVERLAGAGMAVGAHGYRHTRVSKLAAGELAADAARCRDFLTGLGMPLLWAYPFGDLGSFTRADDELLAAAGFGVRFTTLEGPLRVGAGPQPRYVIRRSSSVRYVRAAAAGGLRALAVAKRLRNGLR